MNKLISHIVLFLTLITSCLPKEDTSKTEFVALVQQSEYHREKNFLIKKVYNPNLSIIYGFSDNNYCSRQFIGQEQQLKNSISKSLKVWLAPLAFKGRPIVDRYDYHYRKTTKSNHILDSGDDHFRIIFHKKEKQDRNDSLFPSCSSNRRKESADLVIIFYCQQGRSFMWMTKDHAEIHMYQGQKTVKVGVTDRKKYKLSILHHEMGHAFGLADTYVEPEKEVYRYNFSDGGDPETIGKQPLSVMNSTQAAVNYETGKLLLGDDDVAGINWLYRYYFTKTVEINDCPTDYLYEDSTKGCYPRYPLIFAVKQNDWATIHGLLDNSTTTIDQQDELGNSALHYAAKAHALHGTRLYRFLIDKGANTQLKNNKGKIAGDLLDEI